jgi:hydroxymethylbilane synthase
MRLGLQGEIAEYLSPDDCIPQVGQGALAVESRASDADLVELLGKVDHPPTRTTVSAERSFLTAIGGGCKVPIAAHARLEGRELHVSAMAAAPDGSRIFRARLSGDAGDPESLGRNVAETLMEAGAAEIVDRGAHL